MRKGINITPSLNVNAEYKQNSPQPIFPEWSDHDINEEIWERSLGRIKSSIFFLDDNRDRFKDPQVIHLPPSLSYKQWKKPSEVFLNATFVIFKDRQNCPDLVSDNEHLLESEFMRDFISSINTLWYLGSSTRFIWEFTSSSFSPESSCQWRPWLHIYSKGKVAKGNYHNPLPNRMGKYIVRIFWLGTWRKICIDDMLPVDKNGNIKLITLKANEQNSHTKLSRAEFSEKLKTTSKFIQDTMKTVEMWPFLLSKALLKVACLSWYDNQELLDFDIIQCLTGWIPHKSDMRNLTSNNIWDFCEEHTDQYEWPEEQESHDRKKAQKDKFILFGRYEDTSLENNNGFDLISKWSHRFLILQTRNKPLAKPTNPSDYPLWKRYRWLDWAAEQGIIPPTESPIPVKSLGIVDPFRAIYCPNTEAPGTISKTFKKMSAQMEDSHFWVDYSEMAPKIKNFIVYFKPSGFTSKIRVSETLSSSSPKGIKKTKSEGDHTNFARDIIYSLELKQINNEPLFIFADSSDSRKLILNLSQEGCIKELEVIPVNETLHEVKDDNELNDDNECGPCLTALLERIKRRKELNKVKNKTPEEDIFYVTKHPRVAAHIVVAQYIWSLRNQDNYLTNFRTYGSSTAVLNLKPGRYVLQLYIKSTSLYSLLIICDDNVYVGDHYEVLRFMEEEPHLYKQFCSHVSENFGNLIQSFGTCTFEKYLRNFYGSCRPTRDILRKDLNTLYAVFLDELLNAVKRILGPEKEHHLRILFRQWQRPLRKMSSTSSLLFCYAVNEEDAELVDELQKAAQKIQSAFRGFHDRYLLKCHDPSQKHFRKILDSLSVINRDIFSNIDMLTFILRTIFQRESMVEIAPLYSFYDNIGNTVSLIELSESNLKTISTGWIFICRQTVYVEETVLMKINLFCDLPMYFIRAFNNDTKESVQHHCHYLPAREYTPNNLGYTVTCYGFTDQLQTYSYKLVFIREKHRNDSEVRVVLSEIAVSDLRGNYIPNVQNQITRCLLYNFAELTVATIQLLTSFKNTAVNLKVISNTGEVVVETMAVGDVIIPAVMLQSIVSFYREPSEISKKSVRKSKSPRRPRKSEPVRSTATVQKSYYVIEATVLNNSWPLTSAEWKTVAKIKTEKGYGSKYLDLSKLTKTGTPLDPPYWILQVITDNDETSILQHDKSREEDILEMKTSWFAGFPKRYKEGQDLRKKFLQDNYVTNTGYCSSPTVRSLNSKIFETKVLPPLDLHQYEKVDDLDPSREIVLKTEEISHDEELTDTEINEMLQLEATKMREALNDIMNTQKEESNIYSLWFEECRKESAEMMAEAESLRAEYIHKRRAEVNESALKKLGKSQSRVHIK